MAKYKHSVIAELTHQLELSPLRLRLRQFAATEHLISIIEPDKAYPYDFVCHYITGYRSKQSNTARPMVGQALIEDLVQLVEDLSSARPLPVGAMPSTWWTTEELSQRLKVSTKTISRWRRRGLVGRKLRYPDGTIRMAFAEYSIRRFVSRHIDLVKRGAAFKQLTKKEKDRIVSLARELLAERRMRLHELSQEIAARVGRAVETIRYTLRRYDEAHPEEALFASDEQPVIKPELQAIYDAVQSGRTPASVGREHGRSVKAVEAIVREVRARLLVAQEIQYISNPEFESPSADEVILSAASDSDVPQRKRIRPPKDLPPYLQELYRHPLFTPEQERNIFRRYNYLKFKADRLRSTLDVLDADVKIMDKVDALLVEAERVKNEILKANLRLVVSIARRHVGRSPQFFEIVSDGNLSLMRAVEKFDYARGNKFSTYASWAVMRNFARTIPEHLYAAARTVNGVDELLHAAPAREEEPRESAVEAARHILAKGLRLLTDRERDIVSRHYGLGKDNGPMTLDQIGKLFGVTKERVRQIERRALNKLRESLGGYDEQIAAD
jgi:RNA polymerase sigma factor (sigma-70 family)